MIVGGPIVGGQFLAETPNSDPFKITALTVHMCTGMLILVLMVVRLTVRMATAQASPRGYRQ
jgi:cytochrome b561